MKQIIYDVVAVLFTLMLTGILSSLVDEQMQPSIRIIGCMVALLPGVLIIFKLTELRDG